MSKLCSPWTTIIVISTLIGIMTLTGCGPSKEQQQMSGFLTEYNQAVEVYTELAGNGDSNGISEAKAKVESLQTRWSEIKIEMGSEITPQVLDELDNEFKTITKKYTQVAANA